MAYVAQNREKHLYVTPIGVQIFLFGSLLQIYRPYGAFGKQKEKLVRLNPVSNDMFVDFASQTNLNSFRSDLMNFE